MRRHRKANAFPDLGVPGDPRLLSAIERRTPGIAGGSVNHFHGGTVVTPKRYRKKKPGRFIVSFHKTEAYQRIHVSKGTVARLSPDILEQPIAGKVQPGFPMIGGTAINAATPPYFDAAGLSGVHEVAWEDSGGVGQLVLRPEGSGTEGNDSFVIAFVTFSEAGARIDQRWESDIAWSENGSSSSSSSGGSEDSSSSSSGSETSGSAGSGGSDVSTGSTGSGGGSGDSGSEKSSNAIVRMRHHTTGYGALATVESNEVLFDFRIRDVRISRRTTEIAVDPRFLNVCEPNGFTLSIQGDLPYPVGGEFRDGKIILRALPFFRPNTVSIRLTGVRKGFSAWDMPARTRAQFVANEASIRGMYPR